MDTLNQRDYDALTICIVQESIERDRIMRSEYATRSRQRGRWLAKLTDDGMMLSVVHREKKWGKIYLWDHGRQCFMPPQSPGAYALEMDFSDAVDDEVARG